MSIRVQSQTPHPPKPPIFHTLVAMVDGLDLLLLNCSILRMNMRCLLDVFTSHPVVPRTHWKGLRPVGEQVSEFRAHSPTGDDYSIYVNNCYSMTKNLPIS